MQEDIDGLDFVGFDFDFGIETESEKTDSDKMTLKENWQLIIDCENELDMQLKYEQLQEMGIECRTSTL